MRPFTESALTVGDKRSDRRAFGSHVAAFRRGARPEQKAFCSLGLPAPKGGQFH
jgi:hypothetical protein